MAKKDLSIESLSKDYKDFESKNEYNGVIPTGSIVLDYLLGCNGWMFGHMHEIYGPEASGKTTLVMHAVAEAQKMGVIPLFIDQERTFNYNYAKEMGINIEKDKLPIFSPNDLENGLEIILDFARSGKAKLIVVDSIAAMIPKAIFDKPDGNYVGLKGRILSEWIPKLMIEVEKHKICVLFINQTRAKINIGWQPPGASNDTETVTSGNAIKFYYSTRVRIESKRTIKQTLWNSELYKEEDKRIGQISKLEIIKNKISSPKKREDIQIMFGKGVDNVDFLTDLLDRMGILEIKGGGYGEYKGKNGFTFRGKNTFNEKLREDPKLYKECLEYIPWYKEDKFGKKESKEKKEKKERKKKVVEKIET